MGKGLSKYVSILSIGLVLSLYGNQVFAQIALRLSSWAPPLHPVSTDILGGWAKDVERVTNGKVKVDILKSPVGAPGAYFDLVRNGVVDVAFTTHDFTPNRFVLTRLSELPFLGSSAETSSVALWRTNEKFFSAANEHSGVKVLGLMMHGPGYIYTSKRRLASLDDFKGLKLRASAGIMTDVVTALGGVAVPAPPPKSFEVLSSGVADGTLFPAESISGFSLVPLVKHALKVPGGFYKSSFVIMMNQAKWNALPEDVKQAIWSVSGEALSRRAGAVWDKADQGAEVQLRTAGVRDLVADGPYLAAIQQKLSPVISELQKLVRAKGVDGVAALQFFKDQLSAK